MKWMNAILMIQITIDSKKITYDRSVELLDIEMMYGVIHTSHCPDIQQCSIKCFNRRHCRSFTFLENQGLCKVHNKAYTNIRDGNGISRDGAKYFSVPGGAHQADDESSEKDQSTTKQSGTTEPSIFTTNNNGLPETVETFNFTWVDSESSTNDQSYTNQTGVTEPSIFTTNNNGQPETVDTFSLTMIDDESSIKDQSYTNQPGVTDALSFTSDNNGQTETVNPISLTTAHIMQTSEQVISSTEIKEKTTSD